jgi:hypothetical protein
VCVDVEQVQAEQPGAQPPSMTIDRPRRPLLAVPAAPHACFRRSDDRPELRAVTPARKPATPAVFATALRVGKSRRAEAAIRSLRAGTGRAGEPDLQQHMVLAPDGPSPPELAYAVRLIAEGSSLLDEATTR